MNAKLNRIVVIFVLALVILTSCAPIAQPQPIDQYALSEKIKSDIRVEMQGQFQGQIDALKAENKSLQSEVQALKNQPAPIADPRIAADESRIAALESRFAKSSPGSNWTAQDAQSAYDLHLQAISNAQLRTYVAINKAVIAEFSDAPGISVSNPVFKKYTNDYGLYSIVNGRISGTWNGKTFSIGVEPGDEVNLVEENGSLIAYVIPLTELKGEPQILISTDK